MKPTISKVFYLVSFLTVAFVAYVWYKERNQVIHIEDENGNKAEATLSTKSAKTSSEESKLN